MCIGMVKSMGVGVLAGGGGGGGGGMCIGMVKSMGGGRGVCVVCVYRYGEKYGGGRMCVLV